jgi:hypothetical protein
MPRSLFVSGLFLAGATVLAAQAPRTGSMPIRPHTGPPLVENFASAMIASPPTSLGLDPFYKKYADAFGIPIVSSELVPDAALLMARDIVNYMLLKRPDIRAAMVERSSRVLIMAESEGEMDLPERSSWTKPAKNDPRLTQRERDTYDSPNGIGSMTAQQYWNNRARGSTLSTRWPNTGPKARSGGSGRTSSSTMVTFACSRPTISRRTIRRSTTSWPTCTPAITSRRTSTTRAT